MHSHKFNICRHSEMKLAGSNPSVDNSCCSPSTRHFICAVSVNPTVNEYWLQLGVNLKSAFLGESKTPVDLAPQKLETDLISPQGQGRIELSNTVCYILFSQLLAASEHNNNTITQPLTEKWSLLKNTAQSINITYYKSSYFNVLVRLYSQKIPYLFAFM